MDLRDPERHPKRHAERDPEHHPGHPLAVRLRTAGCVFAEEEAALLTAEASSAEILEDMVRRRCAGLPLEQILGWSAFFGLRVPVAPGVFVPRRRTELLAARALAELEGRKDAVVVELCCGSGAVSLVLATRADCALESYAVDLQTTAVECAGRTLAGLATVLQGDLFFPLPPLLRGRVDVVLANAPYIPTAQLGTIPREARDYEPALTLDGGSDGLDLLRRIIDAAPDWLRTDGRLLLECSERQGNDVAAIMSARGLRPEIVRGQDMDATVAVGRLLPCISRAPI